MMDRFYISARDELGGFYDADSWANVEDARDALCRLYDALEQATVTQSYRIERAIAELNEQITEWEAEQLCE